MIFLKIVLDLKLPKQKQIKKDDFLRKMDDDVRRHFRRRTTMTSRPTKNCFGRKKFPTRFVFLCQLSFEIETRAFLGSRSESTFFPEVFYSGFTRRRRRQSRTLLLPRSRRSSPPPRCRRRRPTSTSSSWRPPSSARPRNLNRNLRRRRPRCTRFSCPASAVLCPPRPGKQTNRSS